MAEYKQSFKHGETVYLLNIADIGVPTVRELVITKVYRSIIIPIARERVKRWLTESNRHSRT